MVSLQWVCNTATGEEHPSQKGCPATVLLQHGKVYMEYWALLRTEAKNVDDVGQFFSLSDLKYHLSRCFWLRLAVKAQPKSPVEQFWQPCSKVGILRDDADLR